MRGHNVCFDAELTKLSLIIKYSLLSRALKFVTSRHKLITRALRACVNARLKLHLENFKSKKGHNFVKKKIGGLPPLLVWVPLLIVNNYSQFQVNIFSNNRDVRKC